MHQKKNVWIDYGFSMLGGGLFAVGMNLFILPAGLYSGTLIGIAQMVEKLLFSLFQGMRDSNINFVGIIQMTMNIPLLMLSYRMISRQFLGKTIATIVFQTLMMVVIPIPAQPLLDNRLVGCIVGGLIAGYGAGITLRHGGSGGGTDIIGMLSINKKSSFSVGRVCMMIGAVVYVYCLIFYELNTVVYSAIYTIIYSMTIDRTHHQIIKSNIFVISKSKEIAAYINHTLERGATLWQGEGTFTGQPTYVCMAVMSKHEAIQLCQDIRQIDPDAFLIQHDHADVRGNFEKRVS